MENADMQCDQVSFSHCKVFMWMRSETDTHTPWPTPVESEASGGQRLPFQRQSWRLPVHPLHQPEPVECLRHTHNTVTHVNIMAMRACGTQPTLWQWEHVEHSQHYGNESMWNTANIMVMRTCGTQSHLSTLWQWEHVGFTDRRLRISPQTVLE